MNSFPFTSISCSYHFPAEDDLLLTTTTQRDISVSPFVPMSPKTKPGCLDAMPSSFGTSFISYVRWLARS